MTTASIFADFWNDQIVAEEKQGLFLVLVGFLLSFAFIRMSTRLMRSPRVPWWPGSVVSESGVHLHHLVFGIVTMMISGAVGFTVLGDGPWAEICAFAFGVGAGLTIDEFALWVYLEDVYWSEQGRVSIDATVIAAGFMGLILLGFTPFDFKTGSIDQFLGSLVAASLVFGLVADLLCQAAPPARGRRLLRLPARDLRRDPDRQAGLTLGPAPLPRAEPDQAGGGGSALRAGSPHREVQERGPRHCRRQAERGSRRCDPGGACRDPRSGRGSAAGRRPDHPSRRRPRPEIGHSPIALITSRFWRRPSNSQ